MYFFYVQNIKTPDAIFRENNKEAKIKDLLLKRTGIKQCYLLETYWSAEQWATTSFFTLICRLRGGGDNMYMYKLVKNIIPIQIRFAIFSSHHVHFLVLSSYHIYFACKIFWFPSSLESQAGAT